MLFQPGSPSAITVESARAAYRPGQLVCRHRDQRAFDPEEAIRFAARVLMDQLSVFADLEGTPTAVEAPGAIDPIPVASGR